MRKNYAKITHRKGVIFMFKINGDTIKFESRHELAELIDALSNQIEKSKEPLPYCQELLNHLTAMAYNW